METTLHFFKKLLYNKDTIENMKICLIWMAAHNRHLILLFVY